MTDLAADQTDDEGVGAEGSEADYGMDSSEGNTLVDELIDDAVERVCELTRDGVSGKDLADAMRSYVREGTSEIEGEHREVNDTCVQGSIVDFVVADAERLHNITVPRFD